MTTILIIDDDEAVRRFLRTVLTNQGYVVAEAPTVAAGIEAVARTEPDVILLDLGSECDDRCRDRADAS